jgi:O-succinylbenzoic acid--CoA ligase
MERAELIALLRATGCAEEHAGEFFLCDPRWTKSDRAQLDALRDQRSAISEPKTQNPKLKTPHSKPETRNPKPETQSNQLSALSDQRSAVSQPKTPNPKPETAAAAAAAGWLCIPTGGTSGAVRFARHDEGTLNAAANGFLKHFGLTRVNAVDVLPAYHVSGLMARVRCAISGGKHLAWDWKALEVGNLPSISGEEWVISLVPTQLQRLLGSAASTEWLRGFRVIFIGGGPTWPALTERAAEARLNLSLSYGMTETAAMITAQRPEEFLAGDRSAGAALPHVEVTVLTDGTIAVTGMSVFRGYWPEVSAARTFRTEDLGQLDASGRLKVLGRRDAVIISGGEKINPLEVEAVLRATGEFSDVAVIGVSDPEWGERVVAGYAVVEGEPAPNLERVRGALAEQLAAYKRPKEYIALAGADWPRNAQGKLNRRELDKYLRG